VIQVENVTKTFGGKVALKNLNCRIPKGCVYGLVGSNGAGKSTFLRLATGVYKPDAGYITYDEQGVYENPQVKERFVFVADELYFLPQSNMKRMAKLYAANYPLFDIARMEQLAEVFGLDPKANMNTFSKGMKRQAATILALACRAEYLFLDETMDGLDPVIRTLVKKVVYDDICSRNATAVITSHSLRELEDTCDQLALLHEGGIILESDVQNLKTSFFKVQVAFDHEYDQAFFDGIEIMAYSQKGSVANLVVKGDKTQVSERIKAKHPVLLEILPLSLEEVFIHEMNLLGYAFGELSEMEEGGVQ